MKAFILFLCLCAPAWAQLPTDPAQVNQYLQDVSVTVKSESGTGSGTVFKRGDETYVLTAGHVVDGLRRTRKVIRDGNEKTIVEFGRPTIIKHYIEKGETVGKVELVGTIVKFSDADHGEDLALIKIAKGSALEKSAVLYEGELVSLGTDILHVGSFHGEFGANSFSKGFLSQYGRTINEKSFFQTSASAVPGSSGGGLFLTSAAQYGVLVRGSDSSINFGVGYQRIRDWFKRANVEYVINPNAEVKPLDSVVEVE